MVHVKNKDFGNNRELSKIVSGFGVSQETVLEWFNEGIPIKLSMRAFKSYQAKEGVKTSAPCPDGVLEHMRQIASGVPPTETRNLVSLVIRLSRALKKAQPDSPIAAAAFDYLRTRNRRKKPHQK